MTRSGHRAPTDLVAMLVRHPTPGRVKTRLIPALGPDGAARLYRKMAEVTAEEIAALRVAGEVAAEVWTDGDVSSARAWLGRGLTFHQQPAGDLGVRLAAIFARAFAHGAQRVAVVGSDCPALTVAHVRSALRSLADVDVVLGAAEDGGYYLIAVRSVAWERARQTMSEGAPWGTADVLAWTEATAGEAGLSTGRLAETLADVDRPQDLDVWEEFRPRRAGEMRLSVVIPTLDEAGVVAEAVCSARDGGADEVIVVDGGSADGTRRIADEAGARVVTSERGRARQMNVGAATAAGDVLLFLHADTVLPPDFAALARETLAAGAVAGAFDFGVPGTGWRHRVITFVGRARARLTSFPLGDQAIFTRARTFTALGGFPELPVMEDWEFVRQVRRLGDIPIVRIAAPTSSRRWDEQGLVRPSARDLTVILGYWAGVEPSRLAMWRSGGVWQRGASS